MPPNEPGTFEQIALELSRALEPFATRLRQNKALALLAELGLQLPGGSFSPALESAIAQTITAAQTLPELIEDLVNAIDGGDTAEILSTGLQVAQQISIVITSLDTTATELGAIGPIPGLDPADLAAIVAELPERLLETLVVEYLAGYHPLILALSELFGLAEQVRENVGSTDLRQPEYVKKALRLERLGTFLQSPEDIIHEVYGWGDSSFDGALILGRIARLLRALDVPVAELEMPDGRPAIEIFLFNLTTTEGLSPPGLEAILMLDIGDGLQFELAVADGVLLEFNAQADLESTLILRLQPPVNVTLAPPAGQVQGQLSARLAHVPIAPATTINLLSVIGGSGLTAERLSFGLVTRFSWNSANGNAQGDFGVEGAVQGGKLRIAMDQGDGFLTELLSGVSLEADFDLGFGWTSGGGVYFTGSSALEIQLPAHIDLGPIDLSAITLSIGIEGNSFPIGLSANIKATLGPLQAVVEQIGASVDLSFPPDGNGNLGPLDLDFGFKPPNGVGLAIDAGVVKGGGYLYFDFDKEEYAGALELVFSGFLTVKAIGLITTRLPDGSKGFSLLIIITAEFGSPIQLGFGFTLIGLGGLLGLNRTMRLEVLAEGVRTGSVENIMFPDDVIANAPRIISDLRTFFPPAKDRFLIGPMAKLGWGTPTLVSVAIGIIIEIPPGNIAILGVLKVALPDEDAALLVLQVNFIGALEVDKKRLWFFASMYDSRVIFITIDGEMGLLVAWGNDSNFVVSVGGFHPAFSPPPLPFPSPKRIAFNILNESFAKIRVEGYFAVTSNTAQFGAKVELFFGLSEFKIEGHLAFDALFQFSPFYFIITISASLSVKVFGIGLFSVRFRGELEGTSPYHVEGEGSISLLFFDIDVPFSHTWGQAEDTTLPPIEVMPLLEAEFNKDDNWTAEVPGGNSLPVSLRKIEATDALVLHPVGTLRISQRAVPLDLGLDKIGNQTPSDVNKARLVVTDADLTKKDDTEEQFATAQFKNLDDAGKLSSPAFEPQNSGVELASGTSQYATGHAVKRAVRYELIIIDNNFKEHVQRFFGFAANLFIHFLAGNAAAKSTLSASYRKQKSPIDQKVSVAAPGFVVASSRDNAIFSQEAQFSSQAKANDYLRERVRANPDLVDQLHVIPAAEMRETA